MENRTIYAWLGDMGAWVDAFCRCFLVTGILTGAFLFKVYWVHNGTIIALSKEESFDNGLVRKNR